MGAIGHPVNTLFIQKEIVVHLERSGHAAPLHQLSLDLRVEKILIWKFFDHNEHSSGKNKVAKVYNDLPG